MLPHDFLSNFINKGYERKAPAMPTGLDLEGVAMNCGGTSDFDEGVGATARCALTLPELIGWTCAQKKCASGQFI